MQKGKPGNLKKAVIFFILLFLCGCNIKKEATDDFFAMDTFMTVKLTGTEEDVTAVREEIYRADNLFKKDKISLSDRETADLAKLAYDISVETDGAFDITVSPLCDLWGFWNNSFRVPEKSEIEETLEFTGFESMTFSENEIILPQGFSIDFGAIAKGYAGKTAAELLKKRGITSAILSLGGNIQTVGNAPDGEKWCVGIKNPFGEEGYSGFVYVSDKAVVTSGGYERNFESEGIKYQHIINPETGAPAETDIASVTVIAENGAVADALSTAFFVMGAEKTEKYCYEKGFKTADTVFSVVIIKENGEKIILGDTDWRKA